MPSLFRTQSDMIAHDHARMGGKMLDPLIPTAEARRLRSQTIAAGVRWLWTNARRIAEHDDLTPFAVGRYSLSSAIADAISRGVLRLAQLVRRILEPYARGRRRRIAIAQLRDLDDRLLADIGLARGEIERTVDGLLARSGEGLARPVKPGLPAAERPHELPLAA